MMKLPMRSTPDEPQASEPAHTHSRLIAAIRDGVIASLGHPPGLYRVTVAPLWLNYYRVNVLLGTDPTAVEIAHSYFVTADDAGRILTATPPLTRLYE